MGVPLSTTCVPGAMVPGTAVSWVGLALGGRCVWPVRAVAVAVNVTWLVVVAVGGGGVSVEVGEGVFVDDGVEVGALTVNSPLMVVTATDEPSGEVAAALLSVRGKVPGAALDLTSKVI